MNPGRELDALVAEKVMGWTETHEYMKNLPPDGPPIACAMLYQFGEMVGVFNGAHDVVPKYSTDISAAWEVFEKFSTVGLLYDECTETWIAHLDFSRRTFGGCRYVEQADTAPHAICLAALKAVGCEVKA